LCFLRALQEAQDIFGVDFDYEDFNQEGEEYEDDEEEEYEDEEGIRKTRKKTGVVVKKKSQRKTIYDVYEPSELERGHFTDFDEKVKILFTLAIVLFLMVNINLTDSKN
jgi:transcription elongation factor SPT6